MKTNNEKFNFLKIFIIEDSTILLEALKIRIEVFVLEQGCPPEEETDDYDFQPWSSNKAVHFIAKLKDKYIGTARIIFPFDKKYSNSPLIQRVAVLKEFRGKNYGNYIMQTLHNFLIEKEFKTAKLSAQLYAIGFYEKLGYKAFGEIYLDAGIKHKAMKIKF
tara:strand:- start:51 stop:536 length:486 start_codon:yes stop_codon:yes gene_type:complete